MVHESNREDIEEALDLLSKFFTCLGICYHRNVLWCNALSGCWPFL